MAEVGFSGGAPQEDVKKKGGARKNGGRKKGAAPPLRVRQYKLNRAKGLNKRQSALKAGFSEVMAANAKKKIEDPYAAYFAAVMEEEIPNDLIAATVRGGMEATALVTATCEGQITDILEVVDWPTRLRATKLAADLRGLAPAKPSSVSLSTGGGPIIFKLTRIGKEISG